MIVLLLILGVIPSIVAEYQYTNSLITNNTIIFVNSSMFIGEVDCNYRLHKDTEISVCSMKIQTYNNEMTAFISKHFNNLYGIGNILHMYCNKERCIYGNMWCD